MPTSPFNPYMNNRGNYDNDNDQVALFIDWDNLVISNYADRGASRPNIEVIVQKAQQYGTLVIARAYAEWNVMLDRLEVYKAGVEPIYAPVFHSQNDLSGQTGKGKSLADPIMVTDCIDFLHLLPQVGTYVLVTGDKDMMPVVRLAKLRGRRVVIIGPDYVANILQQVSDEFVPYRLLLAAAIPVDPYAAYYQQYGYPVPPQPGYYPQPPTTAQTAQQQATNEREARRGRRPGDRRRVTATQPYKDVTMPPTAQPQQPNYNYYPNQQPPAYGYGVQQPGLPQTGYPVTGQQYPTQPQPGYPAAGQPQYSGYPTAGQQYPITAGQQYPGGYPLTPETQAVPQPQAYQNPIVQPTTPQVQPQAYVQQPTPQIQPTPPSPTVTQQPNRSAQNQAAQATPMVVQAQPATSTPAPAPAATPERATVGSNFEEVKDIIRQIMQSRASGRGQMRARDLKEELLRRIPNFNERRYGYSKFKALLNAVEQAGILQLDQSGHILWVTAPGATPTTTTDFGESDSTNVLGVDTANVDDDDDEEEDEVATVLAHVRLEPAVQLEEPTYNLVQLPPITVDAGDKAQTENPFEAAIEAPEQEEGYNPPPIAAAERVTRIEGQGQGQNRQNEPQPIPQMEARPAPVTQAEATQPVSKVETPAPAQKSGKATERIPGLGARPMLLEQPFFEDVIVLVESLRHRNRWLGYELLLSSVRDYLVRHMPESEAKSQAGAILSKLLNESILKMAMEVHSRGARKMRVQVAHLQEDHPAARYALAAARASEAQAAQAATSEEVSQAEATQQLSETEPQPETFPAPDAQTLGAMQDLAAEGETTPVMVVDEGGVPIIAIVSESEGENQPQADFQPSQTEQQPEMAVATTEGEVSQPGGEAQGENQPQADFQPDSYQHSSENQPQADAQTVRELQTSEAVEMQGETGQILPGMPTPTETENQPQAEHVHYEGQTQAEHSHSEGEQPQAEHVHYENHSHGEQQPHFEGQEQGEQPYFGGQPHNEHFDGQPSQQEHFEGQQPEMTAPAGGEAGDLGHEAQPQMEQPHDPIAEVVSPLEAEQHTPQPVSPEHEPQQPYAEPEFTPQHEPRPEYEPQHQPQQPEYEPQQEPHSHHEAAAGHQSEMQAVTGEEVHSQVIEMPGAEGDTGQQVQGEPQYAPDGEEPASAGGFKNTVELEAAHPVDDTQHAHDGVEAEGEEEEADEEVVDPQIIAPGVPVRRPRRRRTTHPRPEGQAETMAQPRELRQHNNCHVPPRRPNRGH